LKDTFDSNEDVSSFIFCKIESLQVHTNKSFKLENTDDDNQEQEFTQEEQIENEKFKEATKKFHKLFNINENEKLVNCKSF
jgi:hypothetical protein